MVEDDDGRRWELTVRGLKRWRRLQFPNEVVAAPVAGVDRRQGGGGVLSMCSLRGKRGRGRKTWAGGDRRLLTVGGGGAAGRGQCGGSTMRWRRTWGGGGGWRCCQSAVARPRRERAGDACACVRGRC
jgi:hypothetical protein